MQFFKKMCGCQKRAHYPCRLNELIWSILGIFIAIACVSGIQLILFNSLIQYSVTVASLGASAILVFGAPTSHFSQPRNLILGQMVSAFCGVSAVLILKEHLWLASALAVSSSFLFMQLTQTMHPPGGATALFAVIGGSSIQQLGYIYVFLPAGLGATIIMLVALIFINLAKHKQYPQYWF